MDEFRCAEDEIESVRRELLADIAGIQWGHGGRTALQLMRFDAYYERFTDRATAVAQRMKLVYEDSPDDY